MRSVPRAVLLIAALALPVAAVLISFSLTDGPRTPEVPAQVRIGSSPGPTPAPEPSVHPPAAELPPPPPDDDDDDDRDDRDD